MLQNSLTDEGAAFALLPSEYVITYPSGRRDVMERSDEYLGSLGDAYVGQICTDERSGVEYLGCLACGDAIERTNAGCCEACRLDMANDEANYDDARADA